MASEKLTDDQKQSAQAALTGTVSYATLGAEDETWKRFAGQLLETLASRKDEFDSSAESSIFVLVDHPLQYGDRQGAVKVIDLDRKGSATLFGKVFYVGESANGGVAFPKESQETALAQLDQHGLNSLPTVTFYPAEGICRVYPEGIGNIENQSLLLIKKPPAAFSLASVVEVVSQFHEIGLVIPDKTPTVFWENASTWLPASTAENTIQWPLLASFTFQFGPEVTVESENQTPVGTADFVFYASEGKKSDPPLGMVETKVQKSYRASGEVPPSETGRELIRGMIQVLAYKKARQMGWGALVCFDLRKPATGGDAAWNNARARCQRVVGLLEKKHGEAPLVFNWLVFADAKVAQAAEVLGPLRNDDALYPVTKRCDYLAALGTTG
jgi:hypothetical protein